MFVDSGGPEETGKTKSYGVNRDSTHPLILDSKRVESNQHTLKSDESFPFHRTPVEFGSVQMEIY